MKMKSSTFLDFLKFGFWKIDFFEITKNFITVFGQLNIDPNRKSKVLLHKVALKFFYDQWFCHKSSVITFRRPHGKLAKYDPDTKYIK